MKHISLIQTRFLAWSFSSSHLSLFSGFRFLYSSKWVKMNLFTWIYLFNDFYSGWLRYFIQLIFSWLLQDTSLIQTWFLAWSFSSSHFSLFSGFRFLYSSKWVRMNIYTWIYLFNDFYFGWFHYFIQLIFSWLLQDTSLIQT